MKYFRILFSAAALLLAASCIDNDVPYPVVELRIAGVEGSGFTVSGISIANRTVTLTLDEKTDIRKVGIDKVTFDAATSNPMMTDTESFIGRRGPSAGNSTCVRRCTSPSRSIRITNGRSWPNSRSNAPLRSQDRSARR